MIKLYAGIITILFLLPLSSFAKKHRSEKAIEQRKGYVNFKLDNSVNGNKPIEAAYVILDKYNHTGAGYVSRKFEVKDNQILISDLPEGKYYVDIFTKGFYKQYFTKVIYVSKKGSSYTFKLEEVRTFIPKKTVMPSESNNFAKTSVVRMK
jgi:hypothetical protein